LLLLLLDIVSINANTDITLTSIIFNHIHFYIQIKIARLFIRAKS
jgi:hypothetical protein